MNLTPKVNAYIDDHRQEAFDLLVEVAQIPAPSHHEEKRAQFCKRWLESQGAEGVYIDEALNVVYPIGDTGDNDLVMYTAHTDVVFPDTTALPLRIEDGKIYCPGVGDDTANVAALMTVAKYIATNHLSPKGTGVLLVLNSCEEGLGDLKGCKQLMKTYGSRLKEFISFDGSYRHIVSGAVGSKRYEITITTEGGHSFSAFGNRNAIYYMASLINTLYTIKVPNRGKTTYNVGTISGGTSVNTIAQNCQMLYEFRSSSREDLAEMEAHLNAAVEFYRTKGIGVEVKLVGDRPCSSEVDAAAHQALLDRAKRATKAHFDVDSGTGSASTDCNIPLSMGIPAVAFGAYKGVGAHTREENLDIDSLYPGLKMVFQMVLEHF